VIPVVRGEDSLRQLFAALIEHAFQVELGIADPPLTDYLSDLLTRFVRIESIYRIRDTQGKRLEEVAEMLLEAQAREAKPRREIYRHIGDFTMFWTGVYPEALPRLQSSASPDRLLDYCAQGKRSYYIASTFDGEPYQEEAPVLRRLSEEFELCTFGLHRVRTEWEKLSADAGKGKLGPDQN
jgi:hypothetical protein